MVPPINNNPVNNYHTTDLQYRPQGDRGYRQITAVGDTKTSIDTALISIAQKVLGNQLPADHLNVKVEAQTIRIQQIDAQGHITPGTHPTVLLLQNGSWSVQPNPGLNVAAPINQAGHAVHVELTTLVQGLLARVKTVYDSSPHHDQPPLGSPPAVSGNVHPGPQPPPIPNMAQPIPIQIPPQNNNNADNDPVPQPIVNVEEYNALLRRNNELEGQIRQLQANLAETEAARRQLFDRWGEKIQETVRAAAKIREQEDTIGNLNEQIRNLSEQAQNNNADPEDLLAARRQIEDLQGRLTQAETTRGQAMQQLEAAQETARQQEAAFQQKQQQWLSLAQDLQQLSNQHEQLKKTNQALTTQLEQQNAEMTLLQQKFELQEQINERLSANNEQLNSQNEELNSQIIELMGLHSKSDENIAKANRLINPKK